MSVLSEIIKDDFVQHEVKMKFGISLEISVLFALAQSHRHKV